MESSGGSASAFSFDRQPPGATQAPSSCSSSSATQEPQMTQVTRQKVLPRTPGGGHTSRSPRSSPRPGVKGKHVKAKADALSVESHTHAPASAATSSSIVPRRTPGHWTPPMGVTPSSVSVESHTHVPVVRPPEGSQDERVNAIVEHSSLSACGESPTIAAGSEIRLAGTPIQVSSNEPNGHMPSKPAITDVLSHTSVGDLPREASDSVSAVAAIGMPPGNAMDWDAIPRSLKREQRPRPSSGPPVDDESMSSDDGGTIGVRVLGLPLQH